MSTERESRDSRIHAPYGFVPLNDTVYHEPAEEKVTSQDEPYSKGLCGTLEVEVTSETPIFIRGAHDKGQFFQGPSGPAIPGSSLRGALRNVVEIASFGLMRRVNDHRYGVRDLQNQDLYVRHMAGIMADLTGKNSPLPKVVAGWLRMRKGAGGLGPTEVAAEIVPCHFAKVHYHDIIAHGGAAGIRGYTPGARQGAVSKYRRWGLRSGADYSAAPPFMARADVERLRPPKPEWLGLDFGRVRRLDTAGGSGPGVAGQLVFTGQPSPWDPNAVPRRGGGNPKHHDFFFYEDLSSRRLKPVEVTREVMEGFDFVHSDGAQQHSLNKGRARNEEWDFWHAAYANGHSVPVFFLMEAGELRAFGLAMMFRLAYKYTVRDGVRSAQGGIDADHGPDLAELLFGHVPLADERRGPDGKEKEKGSLKTARKGRVSVGLCAAVGAPRPLPPVSAVLGAPKASYYPAYIEQRGPDQPGAAPVGGKDKYKTFMDPDVRLRGYKRYRVQPGVVRGPQAQRRGDGTENQNVGVTFAPLPAGTVFRGRIRLHNLRPFELGALLWALDFGGEPGCSHMLGMAKSLGYGRCQLKVTGSRVYRNSDLEWSEPVPLDTVKAEALGAFTKEMEAFRERMRIERGDGVRGGWANSRTITELVGLAKPISEDSPHRNHMSIAAVGYEGRKLNQFVEGKRAGMALPSAVSDEAWEAKAGPRPEGAVAPSPTSTTAQGAPGPRGERGDAGPPRPSVPQPPPAPGRGWTAIKGGTPVEVVLVGLNKKGNWNAKLAPSAAHGLDTFGTVSGAGPAAAAAGETHKVVMVQGGDPKNLGFKWG